MGGSQSSRGVAANKFLTSTKFVIYKKQRRLPLTGLELGLGNVTQKSYDLPHLSVATVVLFLWLLKEAFLFFFFLLSGSALFFPEAVSAPAESNSLGCFSYLCPANCSAWAGKCKCSVTRAPWGLSSRRWSDPHTKT